MVCCRGGEGLLLRSWRNAAATGVVRLWGPPALAVTKSARVLLPWRSQGADCGAAAALRERAAAGHLQKARAARLQQRCLRALLAFVFKPAALAPLPVAMPPYVFLQSSEIITL
jgi:hypothetical protein